MTKANPPSDPAALEALIQGYVDGALSPDDQARAEAALAQSEDARAIAARLRREAAAFRALLDADLDASAKAGSAHGAHAGLRAARAAVRTPPPRTSASRTTLPRTTLPRTTLPRTTAPGRRSRALAAIGAGALAAGLAAGFFLPRPSEPDGPPGWRLSAAIYQRLYAAETFASAPTDPQIGFAALETALGADFSAAAAAPGLAPRRVQLLRFGDRPLGHIAFTTPDGAPIALCVFRRAEPGAPSVRAETQRLAEVDTRFWRTETHDFLLLGDGSEADLDALAAAFRDLLG